MQVLAGGEKYGYELVETLARQSNGLLDIGQSTLYRCCTISRRKAW